MPVSGRRTPSTYNASSKAFNPRLIFSQIVAMQCFHYFFLVFLFQVNHLLYGTSITLDRVFSDKHVGIWTMRGWVDSFAVLLAEAMGSVLLAIIVEKSKKCLDFSVTIFLIHFLLCTMYDGLPATWDWWIVHVFGTIMMVLLGEYLCSRRELDEIPLLQI